MHEGVKSTKRCFHIYTYIYMHIYKNIHITEAERDRQDVTHACLISLAQESRNTSIIPLYMKRHRVNLCDLKLDKTIKCWLATGKCVWFFFLWPRSKMFLLYRAKVQGMTQSQEGNTKKIPLSVKLDKTRLITHRQRTKINLWSHIKTQEEFQQPKVEDVKFSNRGKLRQDIDIQSLKDEERREVPLRNRKPKNTVLLNCQKSPKY